MSKPWYEYQDWNNFRQQYSWATFPVNGDDIAMPQDTPVTALFPATLSNQYVDASGGVEIFKADNPTDLNGIPYYYYAHLDQFQPGLSIGSHVGAGQQIGLSGGQNTGGTYNAAPQYSSGPHIMIGESKSNSIPDTLDTITPDLNPSWMLQYARGVKVNTGTPGILLSSQVPTSWNPIQDIQDFIHNIPNFWAGITNIYGWLSNPIRIIKLIIGIGLLIAAILLMAAPVLAGTTKV